MSKDLELSELKENIVLDEEPILSRNNENLNEEVMVSSDDLEPVFDIPVKVSAVLGRTKISINQLLKLNKGAIIELDKKVGELVDIYVNDKLVAKGEVVIVEDKLGITMSEIVKSIK